MEIKEKSGKPSGKVEREREKMRGKKYLKKKGNGALSGRPEPHQWPDGKKERVCKCVCVCVSVCVSVCLFGQRRQQ